MDTYLSILIKLKLYSQIRCFVP